MLQEYIVAKNLYIEPKIINTNTFASQIESFTENYGYAYDNIPHIKLLALSGFRSSSPDINLKISSIASQSSVQYNLSVDAFKSFDIVQLGLFVTNDKDCDLINGMNEFSCPYSQSGSQPVNAIFGITEISAHNNDENIDFSIELDRIDTDMVIFNVLVSGGTTILELKVSVVLVKSDAIYNQGLQSYSFNLVIPSQFNDAISNDTDDIFRDRESFLVPKSNYLKAPQHISFLSKIALSNQNPNIIVDSYLGATDDNFLLDIHYEGIGTQIEAFGINVILLCTWKGNCLYETDKPSIDSTGYYQSLSYLMTIGNWNFASGIRSDNFSLLFDYFYDEPPKYFAVSLVGSLLISELNYLDYQITKVGKNYFSIDITVGDGAYFTMNFARNYISNYDGLQFHYYDFSSHPNFASTFGGTSTGNRSLIYDLEFDPCLELRANAGGFLTFLSWNYSSSASIFGLNSTFISSNSTHIKIAINVSGDAQIYMLKGYLVVYTQIDDFFSLEAIRLGIDDPPPLGNHWEGMNVIKSTYTIHKYPKEIWQRFHFLTTLVLNLSQTVVYMQDYNDGYDSTSSYLLSSNMLYQNTLMALGYYHIIIDFDNERIYSPEFNPGNPFDPYSSLSIYIEEEFYNNNYTYSFLIADIAYFDKSKMIFNHSLSYLPRIIKFKSFKQTSYTTASLLFNIIDIPVQSNASIFYLKLVRTDEWIIGFYQNSFPEYIDEGFPEYSIVSDFEKLSESMNSQNNMTVTVTSILGYDLGTQQSCFVKFNFSGIMRELYFNGEFIFGDSSFNFFTFREKTTISSYIFSPNELIYAKSIGYQLVIHSMKLGCTYTTIPLYQLKVDEIKFQNEIKFAGNNTYCPDFCLNCRNSSYCLLCQDGYLLNQNHICSKECQISALSSFRGKFCSYIGFQVLINKTLNTVIYPTSDGVINYYYLDRINVTEIIIIYFLSIDIGNFNNRLMLDPDPYTTDQLAESKTVLKSVSNQKFFLNDNLNRVSTIQGQIDVIFYEGIRGYVLVANCQYNFQFLTSPMYYAWPNALFSSSIEKRIEFAIDCLSPCQLTVKINGSVRIYANHKTVILDMNVLQSTTYTLGRNFVGTNYIGIFMEGFSSFNFSLTGNYSIHSPKEFLGQDIIMISPTDSSCSIFHCINCLNQSYCLSCEDGYYLSISRSNCVNMCDNIYFQNEFERSCDCPYQNCSYNMSSRILNNYSYCNPPLLDLKESPLLNGSKAYQLIVDTSTIISDSMTSNLSPFNSSNTTPLSLSSWSLANSSYYVTGKIHSSSGVDVFTYFQLSFSSPINYIGDPIIKIRYAVNQTFSLNFSLDCNINPTIQLQEYPKFTYSSFNTNTSSYSISIPACSLDSGQQYILSSRFLAPQLNLSFPVVLDTSEKIIFAKILNGDRLFPYDKTLTLVLMHTVLSSCPSDLDQSYTYIWSCHDVDNSLCNLPTNQINSDLLTIPLHFPIGSNIIFSVLLKHGLESWTFSTAVNFTGSNTLIVDLSCTQSIGEYCAISDRTHPLKVTALIMNNSISDYDYQWTVTPQISLYTFKNHIKILENFFVTRVKFFVLGVRVTNGNNIGYASINITLSDPPAGGWFNVTPQTGIALSTIYEMSALFWDDNELPLSYEFFYKDGLNWKSFATPGESSLLYSILPFSNNSSTVQLLSRVYDFFGAYGELYASVEAIKIESNYANLASVAISKLNLSNQENCLSTLNILSDSMAYLSPNSQENSQISNIKSSISELINNMTPVNTQESMWMIDIITRLSELSKASGLNTQQSILSNFVNYRKKIAEIPSNQIDLVCQTLSNLFDYINQYDCEFKTAFSQEIRNLSSTVFSEVAHNIQEYQITNENASIISTKNFDIYSRKVTECELLSQNITTSIAASSILLKIKDKTTACTNQTLLFSYYAFNDRLFDCTNYTGPITKSDFAMNITKILPNRTATSVLNKYTAQVSLPLGGSCPSQCSNTTSRCECENLEIFDIKGQLLALFKNSNIKALTNISALADWKFYSDPTFWFLLTFLLWWIVTDYAVKEKLKESCLIRESVDTKKTNWLFFKLMFTASNALFAIYFVVISDISKRKRAFVYFAQMICMLGFSMLFKTEENNQIGNFFNPYLIILPYFTFIPIYGYLQSLMIEKRKMIGGRLHVTNSKTQKIALFLLLLLTLGWLFILIVIAANQKSQNKVSALLQFTKVFVQDIVVSPIILMAFQITLVKILKTKFSRRRAKVQKTIFESLAEPTLLLYQLKPNAEKKRMINRKAKLSMAFKFKNPRSNQELLKK